MKYKYMYIYMCVCVCEWVSERDRQTDRDRQRSLSAGAVEYAVCISVEGLEPTNWCPRYDTKLSDGEASVLELWEIGSTPSLPLLPSPLDFEW